MRPTSLMVAGMFVAAALVAPLVPAFAAGRDMAVLVVGNGADKDMAARERAVIESLTRQRLQRGWSHKLLPIYSYHFDKAAERAYCEERLKVKAGDLVVVGLVELESGVPVDFVYRESTVSNAGSTADKVMDRARAELTARGRIASSSPSATPKPVASSTPRPVASATPKPVASATPKPVASSTPKPVASATPKPVASATPKPVASATPKPVASATPKPVASATPKPVASATPKPAASATPKPAGHGSTSVVVTTSPAVPILKPVKWKPRPKPAKPATPAPTPARPAAPVSVPSGAAGERWAIQLGLFSTLEKAHLAIEKLHETNPDLQAEIRKGTKDDQVVYRVIAGSFPSQSEAYTRAKALAEVGLSGFSVKVDAALGTLVK